MIDKHGRQCSLRTNVYQAFTKRLGDKPLDWSKLLARYAQLCQRFPWFMPEKYGDGALTRVFDPRTFVHTVCTRPEFSDAFVSLGTERKDVVIAAWNIYPTGFTGRALRQERSSDDYAAAWTSLALAFESDLTQWHSAFSDLEGMYLLERDQLSGNPANNVLEWSGLAFAHDGLLDLPWLTVFGPMYVEFFERDRLLNAPAEVIQELAPGYIQVQLTKRYTDIAENWDHFNARRQAVMDHLGRDAFQRVILPSEQPPPVHRPGSCLAFSTRFPEQLRECRLRDEASLVANAARNLAAAQSRPPPPLNGLDEMVQNISRIRIAYFNGSFLIVDKLRKEAISVQDVSILWAWVSALVEAGAETTTESRGLYDEIRRQLAKRSTPE